MRTKVLITVTTYPLPSRSYDELVCTAGILEDGSWIRIYPVPFQFLNFHKYQWVEIDLLPRDDRRDFRPESYQPRNPDLSDLVVLEKIDTEQNWHNRKLACLKNVYTNMERLIEDSKSPKNVSLAAFRPKKIRRLLILDDEREWKQEWLEQLRQVDMFTKGKGETDNEARVPIDKIPYKLKYEFEDESGKVSTMTLEDWEIGALYRNCLRSSEGDEIVALEKVKQKYETEFLQENEITLFLGTTLEHHRQRHNNPFTIIGVFYPKKELQGDLLG